MLFMFLFAIQLIPIDCNSHDTIKLYQRANDMCNCVAFTNYLTATLIVAILKFMQQNLKMLSF